MLTMVGLFTECLLHTRLLIFMIYFCSPFLLQICLTNYVSFVRCGGEWRKSDFSKRQRSQWNWKHKLRRDQSHLCWGQEELQDFQILSDTQIRSEADSCTPWDDKQTATVARVEMPAHTLKPTTVHVSSLAHTLLRECAECSSTNADGRCFLAWTRRVTCERNHSDTAQSFAKPSSRLSGTHPWPLSLGGLES